MKTFHTFNNRNYNRLTYSLPAIIQELIEGNGQGKNTGVYLAGGSIRSIFDGTEVKDYDLFFRDESFSTSINVFLASVAKVVFKCPEGKLSTYKLGAMKIQCITEKFYDSVVDLLDDFDLTASQYVYYFQCAKPFLTVNTTTLKDSKRKHINLHKVTYPYATLKRIHKYQSKGYFLTQEAAHEFVKQTAHLSNSNITEPTWRAYID